MNEGLGHTAGKPRDGMCRECIWVILAALLRLSKRNCSEQGPRCTQRIAWQPRARALEGRVGRRLADGSESRVLTNDCDVGSRPKSKKVATQLTGGSAQPVQSAAYGGVDNFGLAGACASPG